MFAKIFHQKATPQVFSIQCSVVTFQESFVRNFQLSNFFFFFQWSPNGERTKNFCLDVFPLMLIVISYSFLIDVPFHLVLISDHWERGRAPESSFFYLLLRNKSYPKAHFLVSSPYCHTLVLRNSCRDDTHTRVWIVVSLIWIRVCNTCILIWELGKWNFWSTLSYGQNKAENPWVWSSIWLQ